MAKLKVVTAEDAAQTAPQTLAEALERSELAGLMMMRSKIAAEIDGGVPPHTLAPLTRQLRDIDREIRALELRDQEEADGDDRAPDEAFDAEAL